MNLEDLKKSPYDTLKTEYNSKIHTSKNLKIKCSTSNSIEVNWLNESPIEIKENEILKNIEEVNVTYKSTKYFDGKNKGSPLDLHTSIIYHPKMKTASKIIIFIPGGGFVQCKYSTAKINEKKYFASFGYSIVSIEYHIIGQGIYKDALDDILDLINFLKENKEKYNLDINNISLYGSSAGGYLATLFSIKEKIKEIKCCVILYGICSLGKTGDDFDDEGKLSHLDKNSVESHFIFGVYSNKSILDNVDEVNLSDPLFYINGKEVPFLLFTGDEDNLISPSQSLNLHNKLLQFGVKSIRYSLQGATHGKGGFNCEKCMKVILDFLEENLK